MRGHRCKYPFKVVCFSRLLKCLRSLYANSVDPDQTAPIGAVWSGSTLIACILDSSLMLGNYLQQTTSADNIFKCIFVLALLGLIMVHPFSYTYFLQCTSVFNCRHAPLLMTLILCILETLKRALLQTLKTQMKCFIMRHFIRVYTVC